LKPIFEPQKTSFHDSITTLKKQAENFFFRNDGDFFKNDGADPRIFPTYGTATQSDLHLRIKLYGYKKLYWRNVFGFALTGLMVTVPAGVATMNIPLALSGVLKAPMYMLSDALGLKTEGGEYGTGFIFFSILSKQAF